MLSELEAGLGYTFRDKSILENALTHSSYANENRERGLRDNERLEFLGDSILGFVVADYLYRSFPDRTEGELTRIRADLVCEKNLARAAGTISLGSFLLLGHGEEHGGGRKRDSIVSDAMESVIAASYMDGGFSAAKEIIDRLILCDVPAGKPHNFDYKTALQELVQRKKDQVLCYELIGESGPDHDKKFEVEVLLNGKPCGKGSGSSFAYPFVPVYGRMSYRTDAGSYDEYFEWGAACGQYSGSSGVYDHASWGFLFFRGNPHVCGDLSVTEDPFKKEKSVYSSGR